VISLISVVVVTASIFSVFSFCPLLSLFLCVLRPLLADFEFDLEFDLAFGFDLDPLFLL
jgi:hypothetical protein